MSSFVYFGLAAALSVIPIVRLSSVGSVVVDALFSLIASAAVAEVLLRRNDLRDRNLVVAALFVSNVALWTTAICAATAANLATALLIVTTLIVLSERESPASSSSSSPTTLMFLEGTSSLGKTSASDLSLDLAKYVKAMPAYAKKQENVWLQTMYDARLYHDYVALMLRHREGRRRGGGGDELFVCDRSYVSQLIYGILFAFRGDVSTPERFREVVRENVFDATEVVEQLRGVLNDWAVMERRLAGPSVSNAWVTAMDPRTTARALLRRGGFDSRRDRFVATNYISNQNWLFAQCLGLYDPENRPCARSVHFVNRPTLRTLTDECIDKKTK